mgnify:CR=1 FL=1
MVNPIGNSQIGGQEAGGSTGTANVDFRFLFGKGTAQTGDGNFPFFLIHTGRKAQRLESSEKRTPFRREVPCARVASKSARFVMLLEPGTETCKGVCSVNSDFCMVR